MQQSDEKRANTELEDVPVIVNDRFLTPMRMKMDVTTSVVRVKVNMQSQRIRSKNDEHHGDRGFHPADKTARNVHAKGQHGATADQQGRGMSESPDCASQR